MNDDMGSQAMRVIALLARKVNGDEDIDDIDSVESDLVFLGLIGIMDPPRPEVKAAIETCLRAGIKVKMITGDQQMTAAAIGAELNITSASGASLDGKELASLSDEELMEASGEVAIYSRVTPDQKMRIVSSLQEQGEIVAMTGDGVNDAPALSGANIGIAMGSLARTLPRMPLTWCCRTITLPTLSTPWKKDGRSTKTLSLIHISEPTRL